MQKKPPIGILRPKTEEKHIKIKTHLTKMIEDVFLYKE